jgi:hypothetical protein
VDLPIVGELENAGLIRLRPTFCCALDIWICDHCYTLWRRPVGIAPIAARQTLDLTPALTWADSCTPSIHLPCSTAGFALPEYRVSTHLAVRGERGEGGVDELTAKERLCRVAPLRQWLALTVIWVSAAARRRLTTCLVRILRTPITLVLMYCARKEQCRNVGDVLTHQKRFLVPPVPAVEGSIIDFCLWNALGDAGSLNSGGAGDEGADDAVIVAILVVRENVALLPTRLRQLQLCAVALNTSQRVVLAASS